MYFACPFVLKCGYNPLLMQLKIYNSVACLCGSHCISTVGQGGSWAAAEDDNNRDDMLFNNHA